MIRAVIDTNVLVSRYLSPAGVPARIWDLWRAGRFVVLISAALLAEFERVMLYDHIAVRHRLTAAEVARDVANIREIADFINPHIQITAVQGDPTDDKFLECAVAGHADYIVSGDKLDFIHCPTYGQATRCEAATQE